MPGGLHSNREFTASCVECDTGVSDEINNLLCDPQTAGGLLVSVSRADSAALVEKLRESGIFAAEVGEVLPKTKPLIHITA
jgi:selenide,water dikinase